MWYYPYSTDFFPSVRPMASNPPTPDASKPATAAKISATLRKQLEQLFQYGVDKQKLGDFDYAHSMFSQCATRDPSNLDYVEAMFENLKAMHEGVPRKKLKVKESRTKFKKALSEEKWKKALKLGPAFLKENPWDIPTLRGMAQACEAFGYNEVELRYLKAALSSNSQDIEVNKHCATSLARMGQFDQAIACWHRIEEDLRSEARTNITRLMQIKARQAQGIVYPEDPNAVAASTVQSESEQDDQSPRDPSQDDNDATVPKSTEPKSTKTAVDAEKSSPSLRKTDSTERPPTVADLENTITRSPEEVGAYLQLADLHTKEKRYRESEQVLRRALAASGNDLKIQEALEKAQIRRSKSYLLSAEQQAKEHPGAESDEKLAKIRRQHNRMELDIYGARAERYPDDLTLKYEVAVRLKRSGNFAEAVKYFQEAQADERCAGSALLAAGECLQQIRQYTPALQSYEKAVESSSENPESETYRLALYRAGVLATGLKDPVRAKKWLTRLVQLDPDYRDASGRLDKLG